MSRRWFRFGDDVWSSYAEMTALDEQQEYESLRAAYYLIDECGEEPERGAIEVAGRRPQKEDR